MGFFVLCTQWVLHFVAYLVPSYPDNPEEFKKRDTENKQFTADFELSRTSALICLSALMEWSVLLLLLLSSPLSSLNVNNNKHTTSVWPLCHWKRTLADQCQTAMKQTRTLTHTHTQQRLNQFSSLKGFAAVVKPKHTLQGWAAVWLDICILNEWTWLFPRTFKSLRLSTKLKKQKLVSHLFFSWFCIFNSLKTW